MTLPKRALPVLFLIAYGTVSGVTAHLRTPRSEPCSGTCNSCGIPIDQREAAKPPAYRAERPGKDATALSVQRGERPATKP